MSDRPFLLYDEAPAGKHRALAQLAAHGIGDTMLEYHQYRLPLFESIAARSPEERCIALIDLVADDASDNAYSGVRVTETIARHPQLRERCIPVAYTIHERTDVIELAARHRAAALVSKSGLDLTSPEGAETLLEFLLRVRDHRPPEFETFPDLPSSARSARSPDTESDALATVHRLLRNGHHGPPAILAKPYFWHALRHLADQRDIATVAHWIHEDYDVSPSTVRNQLEALRRELAPRFRFRQPDLERFAQTVFREHPAQRAAPDAATMLRLLPIFDLDDAIWKDQRYRDQSYIDPQAAAAVDRVLARFPQLGSRRAGNSGMWRHTSDVGAALAQVEPDQTAFPKFRAAFIRGILAIHDAYQADPAA